MKNQCDIVLFAVKGIDHCLGVVFLPSCDQAQVAPAFHVVMLVSNGHAFAPGFWLGLPTKAPRFRQAWPSSTAV